MGRLLKWFAIGLLGLVLLVVLAIGAVVMFVDPNDYRDEIAQAVQERMGRELRIDGEIRLSFWPWLGLEIGRTTLADAEGFGSEPFAQIDRAYLAVEVLPLLRRQVVLDTIALEGVQARLIVDEQGRGNWEGLIEQAAEPELAREPAPEREPESGGAPVMVADIGGLRLIDAAVSYEDRRTGERYEASPLNLQIDRVRFDEPVPVAADWVARLPDGSEISGRLETALVFDQALSRLQAQALKADVAARLADGLQAGVQVAASVSFTDSFEQASVQNFELRGSAKGAGIPGGEQQVRVQAPRIDADLAAGRYSVPELLLQAAGVDMRLRAEAMQHGDDLQASADVEIASFDARALMQRLDIAEPERADPGTLARVDGAAAIRWENGQLVVNELRLRLDDTTLAGNAKVRSFDGPAVDFALAVDAIDLDRYLPPPAEEEETAESSEGGEGSGELDLPIDLLRGLDVNGEFKVGRLQVTGLQLADLRAVLRADGGQLRLAPVSANLYQGQFAGDVLLDVRSDTPRLTVKQRLESVQTGPLLEDMLGEDWVTGRGDVEMDLAMAGNSIDAWLKSLSGSGRFALNDGTIRGINIAQEIRVAEAKLRQQQVPDEPARQTDFARLTGSFTARGGIIRNDDLAGQSPLLRISGQGQVNLVESTIDYRLTTNIVGTLTGADGRSLDEVRRVPVPVRIRGPLDDFSVQVDLQAALMDLYGEELRERASEEEEQIKERLRKQQERLQRRAEEAVRGLLGR